MNNKTLTTTLISLCVIVLSACSDNSQPNIDYTQDMMVSPAMRAQKYDEWSPNHSSARVPPENTVPVGFKPYMYKDIEQAARELKNPMAGDMSPAVLMTGQKFFETNCMICHGAKGEGGVAAGSLVAEKMALKPPPLTSDKIRGWNDAKIYHTITMGQGLMGPYATHIPQQYRWQVVNYIRQLQKENK